MSRNSLVDDLELYAKYKRLERENICALFRNIMDIAFLQIMKLAGVFIVLMLFGYWLSHEAGLVIVLGMALFLAGVSYIHLLIGNDKLWRITYLVRKFFSNEYSDAARRLEEEYPALLYYDFSRWYISTSWAATEKRDLKFTILFVEPHYIKHLAKYIEMCTQQKRIVPYDEVTVQMKLENR
jgi:hypothetical protein